MFNCFVLLTFYGVILASVFGIQSCADTKVKPGSDSDTDTDSDWSYRREITITSIAS